MPRPRHILAWPAGGHPYQEIVYGQLRRRGWKVTPFSTARLLLRPAPIVHMHWPDLLLLDRRWLLRFAKTALMLTLFALARLRGRAVVWTIHNPALRPEQQSRWGERYMRLLVRICKAVVVLDRSHVGAYGSQDKPTAVIPQPHLRGYYGPPRLLVEARRRLGLALDRQVLGFFGQVRPYKDLGSLIDAFDRLHGSAELLVAGSFDEGCRELQERLRRTNRTLTLSGHVPDAEVAWVLGAIDLLVLPYRELGNSAAALLALSYGRPVLGPANATALMALREAAGRNWVLAYPDGLGPGDLRRGLEELPEPGEEPNLEAFDPDLIGELTDAFMSELVR